MGLDVSHDAFCGAYGAFDRLRERVVTAVNGSCAPHEDKSLDPELWYWEPDEISLKNQPGLKLFLGHSDCDGMISPEDCVIVAGALEEVCEKIDPEETGGGYIWSQGGYVVVLRKFIAGCRLAAELGEDLEFH